MTTVMQSTPAVGAEAHLILLAISALAVCGCTQKPVEAVQQPAAPVTVAAVTSRTVPVEISAVGTVEPYSSVEVKTMVAGQLEKVHFAEGQDVRKGQLLFSIDPRPYQTALDQAEANLTRDRAQVLQLEANLARDIAEAEFAKSQAARYAKLVGDGIIAAEQADQYETNAKARNEAVAAGRAALKTSQAAVQADEAAVRSARVQLSFCTISSPIDGRTGSLLVHEGNIVKLNETVLVTINQLSPTYVSFSVPEQHLPAIRRHLAGGSLKVLASLRGDGAGEPVGGSLSFIDNAVNHSTGTIRLKGVFANGDRRLWPGEFVETTLRVAEEADVPVAPTRAVQTGQDGPYVFVLKPDNTVELRLVTTGRIFGDVTVIDKGLQPGETVVTDGHLRLVNGTHVDVKQEVASGVTLQPNAE